MHGQVPYTPSAHGVFEKREKKVTKYFIASDLEEGNLVYVVQFGPANMRRVKM